MAMATEEKRENGSWHRLNVDIYHTKVFVFIGQRFEMVETVQSYLEKAMMEDGVREGDPKLKLAIKVENFLLNLWNGRMDDDGTDGDSILYDGVGFFIRVSKFEKGNFKHLLTLSHECLHIAAQTLKVVGVRDEESYEALCYLHEYIFGELVLVISKNQTADNLNVESKRQDGLVDVVKIKDIADSIVAESVSREPLDEVMGNYGNEILACIPDNVRFPHDGVPTNTCAIPYTTADYERMFKDICAIGNEITDVASRKLDYKLADYGRRILERIPSHIRWPEKAGVDEEVDVP